MGDGADAGLGGELVLGREALSDVAELGEDPCCADAACAWEGHDDLAVGQFGDGVLDAGGEAGDFGAERLEEGGAGEFAPGVGLRLAGEAGGRGAQAGEQFGRAAASAVGVGGEEAGEAFLAEAAGAVGGRIAAEEGERDRALDVGEEGGGAGPEAGRARSRRAGRGAP